MRRSPLFSVAAVLTIAIGIGANTAMFSLVRGVLLKPLPYPDADRLVVLAESNQALGLETAPVSPLDFLDWQARIHSVDRMAAWVDGSANYTGGAQPETLAMMAVSADYLRLLAASPMMGQGFGREDMDPNGPPIALVTHGFWQRALGARPDVIGRAITLNGVAHTVVGIVPAAWRSAGRRSAGRDPSAENAPRVAREPRAALPEGDRPHAARGLAGTGPCGVQSHGGGVGCRAP
jgi:hypothetical protein